MPDTAVTKPIVTGKDQSAGEHGSQTFPRSDGKTPDESLRAMPSAILDEASLLRPLRRMRQLALEIQEAVARGDMEIMSKAAALLAPSLAQWAQARPGVAPDNAVMLRLTHETQQTLADCEQAVSLAMLPVQARYNKTRQHQSRVRQMRVQRQAQTKNLRPSRLLDARR